MPVAVWGASHQALTLLALAGASGFAYVVDSAPFKQGLQTPVTHLPVVGPTHIAVHAPAAILVVAAAYSDEVVQILRREMNVLGTIAVLRGGQVDIVASTTEPAA